MSDWKLGGEAGAERGQVPGEGARERAGWGQWSRWERSPGVPSRTETGSGLGLRGANEGQRAVRWCCGVQVRDRDVWDPRSLLQRWGVGVGRGRPLSRKG